MQAMLKLASLGWGAKRISRELGCSRNTVRSCLRQGGWQPYQSPQNQRRLGGREPLTDLPCRVPGQWRPRPDP